MAGVAAAQANAGGFHVWPENWPVFMLFCKLQTQWRAGPNGVIGLDYNVVYHRLDRMGLSDSEYEEWDNDLQTMEFSALDAMSKKD